MEMQMNLSSNKRRIHDFRLSFMGMRFYNVPLDHIPL